MIRFQYVPLSSEMYNARGTGQAADFRFPYKNDTFDLVYLASVFTHMFDAEVKNYLDEIGRVLKPGGRCVTTFYLMNDEKREGIAAKTSAFTFGIPFRDCFIERPSPPEGAVAHEENRVLEMIAGARLSVVGRRNTGHGPSRIARTRTSWSWLRAQLEQTSAPDREPSRAGGIVTAADDGRQSTSSG